MWPAECFRRRHQHRRGPVPRSPGGHKAGSVVASLASLRLRRLRAGLAAAVAHQPWGATGRMLAVAVPVAMVSAAGVLAAVVAVTVVVAAVLAAQLVHHHAEDTDVGLVEQ